MTISRPVLLLGLAAVACGGSEQPPPAKTPPPKTETKAETKAPVAAGSSGEAAAGTTMIDPFATDGWAEEDTDEVATVGEVDEGGTGGETDGEPAAPPVYDGPCYVRWSKGPVLRFRYAKDGDSGWLRIDGDNDGKNDVCARFWTKDGRTNKVSVDEGCDKDTDAIISPEYDESANLATATYTDQRSEPSKKQEITLITLPAFTGIAPGYPLYAAKDDIKLDIKDGLVRKATIKEPIEGPAVKVSLRYDDDGRVTRIDEDHGADGKVDRRFDYRYDEVGNVTGITLNETNFADGKKVKTKKTAKLGYKCWAPKE